MEEGTVTPIPRLLRQLSPPTPFLWTRNFRLVIKDFHTTPLRGETEEKYNVVCCRVKMRIKILYNRSKDFWNHVYVIA
jgi:hypothetical protein